VRRSRGWPVRLAVHLLHPVDERCVREAGRVRATSLAELPRFVRSEQQRHKRCRQSLRVLGIDHQPGPSMGHLIWEPADAAHHDRNTGGHRLTHD
jgi:hypothetical protein